MTTTTHTVNEVNLQAVGDLVSAIQEDPNTADTVWKATVDWKGGFRSESRSRDFDAVPSDEPVGLGGDDTAPNPVEQLLGALGNCLVVGYAANASVAGIKLNGLKIELEGDLDLTTFLGLAPGHAGYETIEARVSIEADAAPEEISELHDKVVATSPVGHSLQREVPVRIELA
jgi:uncharacterized OsmC-like protein